MNYRASPHGGSCFRRQRIRLLELDLVLVRLDYVAARIVNANQDDVSSCKIARS